MPVLVTDFILPYANFLHGSAYNLHQILEGLGFVSSSFAERDRAGNIIGGYWSPDQAVVVTLGFLVMLSLALVPLMLAAAYTIGRKRGLLIFVACLLLPGILNVAGWFPDINYLPPRYTIHGVGNLGSEIGLIPLLMISALAGWSLMVLAYDSFSLTERFRQIYDHFWFPLALVAAVFFVADNGAGEDAELLKDATAEVQGASSYLLGQMRRYDDYCKANGLEDLKSCQWSRYSQWTFSHIKEGDAGYFLQFAPNNSKGFYADSRKVASDEDVIAIRKEIAEYNQRVCPVKYLSAEISQSSPLSSSCEYAPYHFCLAKPDGPSGLIDEGILSHTVALASECIVPRLAAAKPSLQQLSELVSKHKKAKNYRWLYFLAVAIAIGAKVALATTKLCSIDSRPPADRRRVIRCLWKFMGLCIRALREVLVYLGGWLSTARLLRLFKRP